MRNMLLVPILLFILAYKAYFNFVDEIVNKLGLVRRKEQLSPICEVFGTRE